jgi:16S rRNA (guanine(1405)-N(7))-methyltransferase
MPEPHGNSVLAQLADDLAEAVARRYRVSRDDAKEAILCEWSRRPDLLEAVGKATGPDEVKRMRAYRDAAAAVKKDIYYRLRRYRQERTVNSRGIAALARLASDSEASDREATIRQIVDEHVSTAERLPHLTEFFENLVAMIGVPETIVDVGCGVLPLVVPFDRSMHATCEYWALDKDPAAMEAVREYARVRADGRVRPIDWSASQGWAAAYEAGLPRSSEVGLLLKVVPVIARQSSSLLTVLAQTPTERLVISASREAMAKRQDIERRETRIVRRFLADYGLSELSSFRTPDEVVFLAQRA